MPFHTLLLRWNGETNFRRLPQYWAKDHLLRLNISEAFLKWWLFPELYGLQSVNAVHNGHKFSDNLSFQSSPKLHCTLFQVLLQLRPASQPVFLNDFVNSLLVGFSWGCLRATATRLILDARVPIFKMLYPSSNTTSTHAHISIHMLKSVVNISSGNLLLTRNSMTPRWRNGTPLSVILYHLFMVTWCKLLTPYLTQRYDNIWRHLPNGTQSFDVAELPTMGFCSWLSIWPSYTISVFCNKCKS